MSATKVVPKPMAYDDDTGSDHMDGIEMGSEHEGEDGHWHKKSSEIEAEKEKRRRRKGKEEKGEEEKGEEEKGEEEKEEEEKKKKKKDNGSEGDDEDDDLALKGFEMDDPEHVQYQKEIAAAKAAAEAAAKAQREAAEDEALMNSFILKEGVNDDSKEARERKKILEEMRQANAIAEEKARKEKARKEKARKESAAGAGSSASTASGAAVATADTDDASSDAIDIHSSDEESGAVATKPHPPADGNDSSDHIHMTSSEDESSATSGSDAELLSAVVQADV